MNATVSNYAPGDLRVSDADRDRAISELSDHFQAGRLTADEFDDRSSQALGARTGTELASLLADLPHGQLATADAAAFPSQSCSRAPAMGIAITLVAIAAGTALIGTHGDQRGFAGLLIPLLGALFVILRRRR